MTKGQIWRGLKIYCNNEASTLNKMSKMPTRTVIIPLFSPIQFQSFGAEVVPLVYSCTRGRQYHEISLEVTWYHKNRDNLLKAYASDESPGVNAKLALNINQYCQALALNNFRTPSTLLTRLELPNIQLHKISCNGDIISILNSRIIENNTCWKWKKFQNT